MKIKILDCTLRDGGYINNWEFGNKNIYKILHALYSSKIDIIEVGYLDEKKGTKNDTTLFDSLFAIDSILSNTDKNNSAQKVVMINLNDFNIDNLYSKSKTQIEGIRLAFHKNDLQQALTYGLKIKQLGYNLYFQPMISKSYSDIEFLSMIEQVNKIQPYAFYIVDSFGSMSLDEFNRYLIFADSNLTTNIALGYHSHNNMQLAFSNAINLCTKNLNREIIIDSSIYGMGRGAGNLNTELIADFLNKTLKSSYNTISLLEVIDELLGSLMIKNPWGFSPAQYLSAYFDCHPNYATFLVNKNTNHIVTIKQILEKLPESKKFSFDKELIEQLYRNEIFKINTPIKDSLILDTNKKILLIASGNSTNHYKNLIALKINTKYYTIVSLNHKPTFDCDFYFFSNQKRYDDFIDNFIDNTDLTKIIITSNIKTNLHLPNVIDFERLVIMENDIVTNSTILFLQYLINSNFTEVEIAGLDGYVIGKPNYSYDEYAIQTDNKLLIEQNNILIKAIKKLKNNIKITLLTPSIFEDIL